MSDLPLLQTSADLQARLRDLAFAQVMVRAMDGTILFWARGMERPYGFSAAEALGRSSHLLLWPARSFIIGKTVSDGLLQLIGPSGARAKGPP
jgi:PAS domain-containing protein